METTPAHTQSVCSECGYNAPHHPQWCSLAPRTVALCPEHFNGTRVGSDDGKFTCATCGAHGYHVRLFLA